MTCISADQFACKNVSDKS